MLYSQSKDFLSGYSAKKDQQASSYDLFEQDGADQAGKLGVCISGGGSRSMALARGQMAVLRKYGIEEQIKDLSLVSGGAWFGVSYYSSELDDRQILGTLVENPEELTVGIEEEHLTCSKGCEVSDSDAGQPVNKSNLHVLTNSSLGNAHKEFSNLPGFLVSFVVGTFSRWLDGSHVWSEFLNQSLSGQFEAPLNNDFFVRKKAEMSIIINALLKKGEHYYPFEVLPEKVRVRSFIDGFKSEYLDHSEFGWVSRGEGGEEQLTLMRVQDALAASSANYANFVWGSLTYFVLPQFKFALKNPGGGAKDDSSYQLIDSGFLDYLGIMPLLARRSDRIIAFINTDIPIIYKGTKENGLLVGLEKALPALFGIQPDEKLIEEQYILMKDSARRKEFKALTRGQVFESDYYAWLAEQFMEKKAAGEPTIVLQKGLRVLKNDFHGIQGGHHVDVLWVYNDLPGKWWRRLDRTVRDCIEGNVIGNWFRGCYTTYTRFPHYSAIMDLHLPAFQANLLFHQASWALEEAERAEQVLSGFLGLH